MLDATIFIGFLGAVVLLVAFLLNQIGHWETTDFEYDFINLIGAVLLTLYGFQISSWPIVLLFAVWTLFSLKDVLVDAVKNFSKKNKKKEEPKEEPRQELHEKSNAIMTEDASKEEPAPAEEPAKEEEKSETPPMNN